MISSHVRADDFPNYWTHVYARTSSVAMGTKICLCIQRRSHEGHNVRFFFSRPSGYVSFPSSIRRWGESAGAISTALHLVANNGDNEGLFRGAFMESGAPIPVGDLTKGQNEYDAIVQKTGCSGASDTLECLRQAPYSTLKAAVDQSPALLGPTVSFTSFKHSCRVTNELTRMLDRVCISHIFPERTEYS